VARITSRQNKSGHHQKAVSQKAVKPQIETQTKPIKALPREHVVEAIYASLTVTH
jgi:hypothetical protein